MWIVRGINIEDTAFKKYYEYDSSTCTKSIVSAKVEGLKTCLYVLQCTHTGMHVCVCALIINVLSLLSY